MLRNSVGHPKQKVTMGRRKGSKNLSQGQKEKILDMVRSGLTQGYVADFYGIPKNTVKYLVGRAKRKNEKDRTSKPGRKHKLGPRCQRRLIKYVRDNNKQPLFVIAARFRTLDGTKLSKRTIRRYLHKKHIRSYIASSKPFLTMKHIDARLSSRTLRHAWTMQQWSKVAFTDECSFTLRPMKNYIRVWRREGSRYETANMVHTFKSGYVSMSVWGLFSARGRTPLVRIVGTLNQQKYIEIL